MPMLNAQLDSASASTRIDLTMSDAPIAPIDALRELPRPLAASRPTPTSRRSTTSSSSRKSGSVTGLLKTLGALPPEARREFGAARQRAQDRDRRRRSTRSAQALGADAAARRRRRRHAARPRAAARPRPSADARAPAGRGHLHAHGLRDPRRPRSRRRLPQLRSAQHAARSSRARHAGHALPRRADRRRHVGRAQRAVAGHVPEAQVRAATLLRTHTSAMQIRYMKTFPPPVRIIVPGRVYRRDNLDLTHTPMFQQFEGLVVGEGITLADLKGTLRGDAARAVRRRAACGCVRASSPTPSRAPKSTSAARAAAASGCGICKQTGWLEILGSGMVHPAVFEAVGYDPETGHRASRSAWASSASRC